VLGMAADRTRHGDTAIAVHGAGDAVLYGGLGEWSKSGNEKGGGEDKSCSKAATHG
jgi:hypothetical protein